MAEASSLFAAVRDISDLRSEQLLALTRAWSGYNGLRAASFQVVAMAGADEAVRLIDVFSVSDARLKSMDGGRDQPETAGT